MLKKYIIKLSDAERETLTERSQTEGFFALGFTRRPARPHCAVARPDKTRGHPTGV
ncbi:MAG: hypothetical protein NTV55_14290 [Planctomycetota bacterium]|nr:hypothetical protein [Planctomycetota bacterium]